MSRRHGCHQCQSLHHIAGEHKVRPHNTYPLHSSRHPEGTRRFALLLHRHALRKITGLIDIAAAAYRNIVRNQLHGNRREDRCEQW